MMNIHELFQRLFMLLSGTFFGSIALVLWSIIPGLWMSLNEGMHSLGNLCLFLTIVFTFITLILTLASISCILVSFKRSDCVCVEVIEQKQEAE